MASTPFTATTTSTARSSSRTTLAWAPREIPILVERAAHVTAEEMAATGINWAFAPCIAVRAIRAGAARMKVLANRRNWPSCLLAPAVRGFQAKIEPLSTTVAACAKHYSGRWRHDRRQRSGQYRCATKPRCAKSFCPPLSGGRKSRRAIPSWCRTAVGTGKKCTATNICSPTC